MDILRVLSNKILSNLQGRRLPQLFCNWVRVPPNDPGYNEKNPSHGAKNHLNFTVRFRAGTSCLSAWREPRLPPYAFRAGPETGDICNSSPTARSSRS